MISIPQVPQSVFPGRERGIGIEFVIDFYVFVDQHHNFVQEIVVYLGDEWGVGIALAKDAEASLMGRGISVTEKTDGILVFADMNGEEGRTVLLNPGKLGVGILHTHEVFTPIGIEHNLASSASGHVDNDIYAGLQFEYEIYAVLARA